MTNIQKPTQKRGVGRPRKNPDRAMTQREINKAYRARRQQKAELMRQLMKQLPTISP
ncbi:hypothetical protein [Komagataeibacter melomenusus]|uniref:hypothetical protein n=1 Tax=Komagataeibacter melomenusus TaxID=2766578 RepID=UPI001C2DCD91|nr:hypothetical protein [Komagataeibacter melomenusus]